MSESEREALRMDLEALRTTLPVIEGSGSTTTTISVSMLRRLYDAALAHPEPEPAPEAEGLREAAEKRIRDQVRSMPPTVDYVQLAIADVLLALSPGPEPVTEQEALWADVRKFIRWAADVRSDTAEAIAIARALNERIEASEATEVYEEGWQDACVETLAILRDEP